MENQRKPQETTGQTQETKGKPKENQRKTKETKGNKKKTKGKTWDLLMKLGDLKNTNKALNGGKNPADYSVLNTNNENILAFKRSKKNFKPKIHCESPETDRLRC